jgi:hypothetical protein
VTGERYHMANEAGQSCGHMHRSPVLAEWCPQQPLDSAPALRPYRLGAWPTTASLTNGHAPCFDGGMPATTMPHLEDHEPTEDETSHAEDGYNPEHVTSGGPCFMCWCYSCGGRTDRPRIERQDDTHPGDPSHRWCFE